MADWVVDVVVLGGLGEVRFRGDGLAGGAHQLLADVDGGVGVPQLAECADLWVCAAQAVLDGAALVHGHASVRGRIQPVAGLALGAVGCDVRGGQANVAIGHIAGERLTDTLIGLEPRHAGRTLIGDSTVLTVWDIAGGVGDGGALVGWVNCVPLSAELATVGREIGHTVRNLDSSHFPAGPILADVAVGAAGAEGGVEAEEAGVLTFDVGRLGGRACAGCGYSETCRALLALATSVALGAVRDVAGHSAAVGRPSVVVDLEDEIVVADATEVVAGAVGAVLDIAAVPNSLDQGR